jgi:hypothetical protein
MIDYSLSKARATAKLEEENSRKAKNSLVEESCKVGEAQGRCDFLEIELGKMRKECEEGKKVKKETAEWEDTWVFSLALPTI